MDVAGPGHDSQTEKDRITANLEKAIELTELALALQLAVMRQQNPNSTTRDVMHEIRLAKEEEWRRWAAQEAGSTLKSEQ